MNTNAVVDSAAPAPKSFVDKPQRGAPISGPVRAVFHSRLILTRHSSHRPSVEDGWEKQLEDRKQREIVQTMQAEMKEERRIEKEEKRRKEQERLQRKVENEKRAEVYQLVSAAKVKRMKKRQLRNLKKVGSDVSGKLDTKNKK
ncbi:hypothetical protein HDU82_006344 [Entophlyctis luteolus]|nr:hypothetical protein HDU82_006344 [Entophlyctis luteolus]